MTPRAPAQTRRKNVRNLPTAKAESRKQNPGRSQPNNTVQCDNQQARRPIIRPEAVSSRPGRSLCPATQLIMVMTHDTSTHPHKTLTTNLTRPQTTPWTPNDTMHNTTCHSSMILPRHPDMCFTTVPFFFPGHADMMATRNHYFNDGGSCFETSIRSQSRLHHNMLLHSVLISHETHTCWRKTK